MMKFTKNIGAALAALVLTTGFAVEALAFTNQVKVKEGTVQGILDQKHNVMSWYGVPYAAPALGENRWQAPAKAEKFKGVKDCTKPAPANIQFNGKKVLGQEGALTLDICRPDTEETNLPVMVFFHGGNNQTSNSRLWLGNKFAKEANVVYVSVQYRLGLFGFNNLPALADGDKYTDGGNYGLVDQAAALEWVQKNITRFGGNPDNITVSGFSAGGRDVMAMLISPLFKDKFHKAISFSGGLTVADPAKSQRVIAKALAPLAVADGVAADEKAAVDLLLSQNKKDKKMVRQYLDKIEAERLAPLMAGALIRMSAFPHLYADDKLLPKEGFATKKYNSVPIIMLASSDEFSSFVARDKYFKNRLDQIGKDKTTTDEFVYANKYGSLFYGYFNGQESAEGIYANYKSPIYVCTFDFGHTSDVVGEAYSRRNGAFHGVFLPFLTDQPYPFYKGTNGFASEGAKALSKAFIGSLGNFMRTGDPNHKLLQQTWQPWNPDYRPELVFDAGEASTRIYSINSRVSYAGLLAELEADKSPISDASRAYMNKYVFNGRWFSEGLDKHFGNEDLWPQE